MKWLWSAKPAPAATRRASRPAARAARSPSRAGGLGRTAPTVSPYSRRKPGRDAPGARRRPRELAQGRRLGSARVQQVARVAQPAGAARSRGSARVRRSRAAGARGPRRRAASSRRLRAARRRCRQPIAVEAAARTCRSWREDRRTLSVAVEAADREHLRPRRPRSRCCGPHRPARWRSCPVRASSAAARKTSQPRPPARPRGTPLDVERLDPVARREREQLELERPHLRLGRPRTLADEVNPSRAHRQLRRGANSPG